MKKLIALVFLTACSGGSSKAPPQPDTSRVRESFFGIDYKFPTNPTMSCAWVKAFRGVKYPVLSFLWHTPGRNFKCLDPFLADGRRKTTLIHLSNGICRKDIKDNCPPTEPKLKDIPNLALEAYTHVKNLCPKCKVLLSPQLEDGLHPGAFCRIVTEIKKKVPEAIIVRNPLYEDYDRGSKKCYDYLELHNNESAFFKERDKPCIWSNDGYDLKIGAGTWDLPYTWTLQEWEQHHRPGCINLLWTADGNCLNTDTAQAPFPADRHCSTDEATISELNRILLENQDE